MGAASHREGRDLGVRVVALVALGILAPAMGYASGSLYVDDSGVMPAGKCQLESWMRNFSGGPHEWTAVPACGTGPVEWSLTLIRDTAPTQRSWSPGIKWLIKDNTQGGFGLAVASSPLYQDGRFQGMDTYLAPNWAWGSDQRWALDANVGGHHERGRSSRPEAGLGFQYTPVESLSLVAEHLWRGVYGHFSQAGLRFNLNRDDSIDVFAGRSHDKTGPQRWMTLGLNVLF